MTSNLDVIIKSLQTELKSRGINVENNFGNTKYNNYLNDLNEKSKIINEGTEFNTKNLGGNNLQKSQPFLRNKNEELQIKEYIEISVYNMIMPLKTDLKSSIEDINIKMNILEKELLKINLMNENIRNVSSKLSKIENDYNLLYKNVVSLNSLSSKNQTNFETLDSNFKTYTNDANKNIYQLKDELSKVSNNQQIFDTKYNFEIYNTNTINNEKKIIDKINKLYKEKEKNLSILTNNLYSKINAYSTESDKKIELLTNSINDIKNKLNSADNNVHLLNELPNIKEVTENNNKEIESIKSKIETISNAADIKNCKEEMENTKNDIQIIKTDIEEINRLKTENKNLNNELNEIKKEMKLFEKKINIMEENFTNLDNQINDNKKDIVLIKKEKNDFKSKNNIASVNDDYIINDKLNKLNSIISENNKTISDLEVFWKNKIREQSKVYNENFININKRMDVFSNEEIKLNEENSKLMEIMGKKIIENNEKIKNIMDSDIKLIFQNFEIINRNFKALNKYNTKINELDKIIKEKVVLDEN